VPNATPDPRLIARCETIARVAAGVVILVGLLVVIGWWRGDPRLAALLAGRFIMQLNTGLAFVLAGATVLAATGRAPAWRFATLGAGTGVALIGAMILIEYLTGWAPFGGSIKTRMEVETASCFVLGGAALVLESGRGRRAVLAAHALTVLMLLIAVAALFGHAYSVKALFGIAAYTSMTMTAAISFVLLGAALLFVRPGQGLMTSVVESGPAGFLARRLYPAVVVIPILLGSLTLAGEQLRLFNGKFGLSLLVLASVLIFVALIALTNRSFERAEAARRRLAAVLLEEAERRHLARELHDEIGQSLTALKARLEMLAKSGASDEVAAAQRLVGDVMRQVSNLSLDLRPAMLDDLGLLPALLWLIERFSADAKIEVAFAHEGIDRRFAREIETAAFRIVQEALSNAVKHAREAQPAVRVFLRDGVLSVQVEDRGPGFSPSDELAAPAGSGLIGMRERAEAVSGRIEIDSKPGAGTRVSAELPVRES